MIVITEFMNERVIQEQLGQFPVVYNPELFNQVDSLKDHMSSAQALIVRNKTQVNKELITTGSQLKCIGRLGVGLDNIDLNACSERNISVFPATGANNISVAEYVIGTAMVLMRNAYLSSASTIHGDWNRTEHIGSEINGKTLGIIGLGEIGQLVAEYACGLGMKVQAYDPYLKSEHPVWQKIKPVDLSELSKTSNIISLHVPLVEATRNLINRDFLSMCKRGAIIINTSRGGILDEEALVHFLQLGHIGGAALDVFATEPLSCAEGQKYSGLNNLILTPHIAGVTIESNYRVSKKIAELVADCLK